MSKYPDCSNHEYRHIETKQWQDLSGYGSFHRTDVFHCIKCAALHTTTKRHNLGQNDNPKYNRPDWFTL